MTTVTQIARYLLALGFIVFGLNGLWTFLEPPKMNEAATEFIGILVSSGYLIPVKLLEIAGGLLLLFPRFVPIGLTLLGPVLVNILIFHLVFDPASTVMALPFALLWVVVFWSRRESFRSIWQS